MYLNAISVINRHDNRTTADWKIEYFCLHLTVSRETICPKRTNGEIMEWTMIQKALGYCLVTIYFCLSTSTFEQSDIL